MSSKLKKRWENIKARRRLLARSWVLFALFGINVYSSIVWFHRDILWLAIVETFISVAVLVIIVVGIWTTWYTEFTPTCWLDDDPAADYFAQRINECAKRNIPVVVDRNNARLGFIDNEDMIMVMLAA